MLETLKTLFQVDFLLPRTIVASLNLRELLETLETELIPVEVCCAALVYFVKTTNRQTYLDEKKVSRTIFDMSNFFIVVFVVI